jgi:hypothetical protein
LQADRKCRDRRADLLVGEVLQQIVSTAPTAGYVEEMDEAREEMRREFGERDLAVDLIRESRDER